jgi:hypothetical protein
LALPDRKYAVIVADPEWQWEPWSRETRMDLAIDTGYESFRAPVPTLDGS